MSRGVFFASLSAPCDRAEGLVDEVSDQLLETGSSELRLEVLRAARVGGEEGEVDLGLEGRGELDLGLLGRLAEPLDDHPVLRHVEALGLA